MTARGRIICAVLLGLVPGCHGGGNGDGDTGGVDLCEGAEQGVVTIGHGVDGVFAPFEDGEDVTLIAASQGGFGIGILVQTEGLVAGEGAYVDVSLDLDRDGSTEGTFYIPQVPLLCAGPDLGGLLSGVVVGLDPDKYESPDDPDVLALEGALVELVVFVTDENGTTASARQPVTIRVGP